jgi:hypothetical protein
MSTIVKNTLEPVIAARFIRIHPRSWQNHISMRVEFNGCFEGMFFKSYVSSNFPKNHILCLRIPNYKLKLFRRFSKQEPISGSVVSYPLSAGNTLGITKTHSQHA